MGLLIIMFILTIIFGIGAYFIDVKTYHDGIALLCSAMSVMIGIVFFIMLCTALYMPIKVKTQTANYNGLKNTIENSRNFNEITEYERFNILEQVIENNKAIENHKSLSGDFWVGIYYSEELGNLDYILIQPNHSDNKAK